MPFDGIDRDPIVQTLMSAKYIIATRGLLKGKVGEFGGARCTIGAIQEAAGVDGRPGHWVRRREEVAWLAAEECYGRAVGSERVEAWQDDPKRTQEEVLAGFDLAVERRLQAIIPTR